MADVSMDYEQIEGVAKGFDAIAAAMKAMEKVLEIVIQTLRAAAMFSFGMTEIWARFWENVKKEVINVGKQAEENASELRRAVTDHRNGDYLGKTYFSS